VIKYTKSGLIFLSFLILSYTLFSQTRFPSEKPKLVIGIVVENMRSEYIYRFKDKFEKDGFNRLINEGVFCKNASYNYLIPQSAPGITSIVTGCSPSVHGIVSDFWYNRTNEEFVDCCADKNQKAIGKSVYSCSYSPKRVLTTSYSDEMKLMLPNKSKVIAISPNYQSAILLGNHAADNVYWFDNNAGKWITNSYYTNETSEWVDKFNLSNLPEIYLQKEWNTILPIDEYTESLADNSSFEIGFDNKSTFPYKLDKLRNKTGDYSLLMQTPFGNSLTKDFLIDVINNNNLGQDESPDVLLVSFTAFAEIEKLFGAKSVEMEDAYLRFDKELAHLFNYIDNEIGKQNVVIYLTSDGNGTTNAKYLSSNKIPVNIFDAEKSTVLLKAYMNAVYGPGDWISKYDNQQIYLNQSLIEDANLSLSEVQEKVAHILLQMSGVANAITATNLQQFDYTDGIFSKIQNSYYSKRSGDVIINLEPGWIEKNHNKLNGKTGKSETVPLLWYGWKIKRKTINRPVSMFDIAPTISNFLTTPYPTGCEGKVILELLD